MPEGSGAATTVVGGRARISRSCTQSCQPGTCDVAGPMTVHWANADVACSQGVEVVLASAD